MTEARVTPADGHQVRVDDLTVTGPRGRIVTGLDLAVEPGHCLAVVGESGSGKSMTAKAMTGLLPPGVTATGTLSLGDRQIDLATDSRQLHRLRGTGIALLLQNPFTSLSPIHRCGDQIAAALPAGRRTREEVVQRLAEVNLPARVARQYPFHLSGGMRQRVAMAASLAPDPEVLIADEPTTALDVTTQREVLDLLDRIRQRRGMAVLLITHDLGVAEERADAITVMYAGRLMEGGPRDQVLSRPRHPYTAALRDCDPPLDRRVERLPAIGGSAPRPWEVKQGCAFAARCPLADDHCRAEEPPLVEDPFPLRCWKPLAAGVDPIPLAPATSAPPVDLDRVMLRVEGATRRFSADAPPALDGVDLTVAVGEAVGIVGESGSGKTTLARCLTGLERLDSGIVQWPLASAAGRRHDPRRAQIVFQDPFSALNPAMSVGATLAEALRAGDRPRGDVPELLEMVGLPTSYAKRKPRALSGGEQQRVAIARALAPGPDLLICDEAVSSLDVSVQAQILNLLKALHADLGLALLFITHDLAVVRQVTTRAYVMARGRVVEQGDIDRLLDDPQDAYTRQLFASVPGGGPR